MIVDVFSDIEFSVLPISMGPELVDSFFLQIRSLFLFTIITETFPVYDNNSETFPVIFILCGLIPFSCWNELKPEKVLDLYNVTSSVLDLTSSSSWILCMFTQVFVSAYGGESNW